MIPPRILEAEIEFSAIRAQGAGGQNVNKVSNAVHARFDIAASSLPDSIKARLLSLADQRVTLDGVIVVKAQDHRSLERNRADAVARLQDLVDAASIVQRVRRPTKPTRGSKLRRLEGKSIRGDIKSGRGRVKDE